MKYFTKLRNDSRGSLLIIMLIVLPFMIAVALAYTKLSLTSTQVARLDQLRTEAQLAADAGADYSVEQLAANNSWSGTGAEITLHSESTFKTTYTSTVSGNTSAKVVSVTGKTYFPANATTPRRTVKIFVDLRPVTSGVFSVISGAGGLKMSNSSKVVGGDVFVNGAIDMQNSSQIGLSTSPVNVKVAHQICPTPADATYPRVCNSGENGEPISMSNQAHIYGTVRATNQTTGTNMSNTGLVAGSTEAPQSLPTYDRAAQKAAVATTITGAAASCSSTQTRTWAANTKITGDVDISTKCKVTVLGDVWITGTLTLRNSGEMAVANSNGANTPHIMVDGITGVSLQNSSTLTANNVGTGFEILTFYSTAGCSPDCSAVTGTNLANSRGLTTINLNNTGDAANTIYYAYWSQVLIQNSGQIGALIGQTINIQNTGTVTFGAGTGTGDVTWVVKGYRRQ